MWQTRELTVDLPESFMLFENAHFAYLCCSRCGWQAIFSATGVNPEEIARATREHGCPKAEVGNR